MTEPSLALQKLVRGRLIASPDVLALVNAAAIFDRHTRPEASPVIVIGEGQSAYGDDYTAFHDKVFIDCHVWTAENDFIRCKAIVGAMRDALRSAPWAVDGHVCHGLSVRHVRWLRDPDGVHAHAVVSIDAVLQRAAA